MTTHMAELKEQVLDRGLEDLEFDNRFTRDLPGDPVLSNTPRQVASSCYSRVWPTPVSEPRLVAVSREVADLLDLSDEAVNSDLFTRVFAGNRILPAMDPYAACYGGHQFGHWAGQLGDGRAITLGDVINHKGERWALQLKGAGLTPYSRTADGLAVLRSSVREFLCSEAMFHLGVPTTRALSLVLTGEQVIRDMFYNGNSKPEPGAVVCRVAPTFTRFGNFQILASRGETDILKQLMNYTLTVDFPHLGKPGKDTYLRWFDQVSRLTAAMIVHWMRVGFVHGVMNTDNMSVLGLTIDYGPYGWLDDFDPGWTPNTTDAGTRRYRFGNQPAIAQWNLAQLAGAILPLIGDVKPLQEILDNYPSLYGQAWQAMMNRKLGLATFRPEEDPELANDLLALLASVETDMTLFFRSLALPSAALESGDTFDLETITATFNAAYYQPEQLTREYRQRLADWRVRYFRRLNLETVTPEVRSRCMNTVNPKVVLRNYLAQMAIDRAEQDDFSMIHRLLERMRRPYDDMEPGDTDLFAGKRPDWARHKPGCSMLSCSS
ncbi:MAG: YdiU family protein [Pseudomonadota bacterium]